MTGVMRPPSGIVTAMATLMCSLYVMPLPSAVHAAYHTAVSLPVIQTYRTGGTPATDAAGHQTMHRKTDMITTRHGHEPYVCAAQCSQPVAVVPCMLCNHAVVI